MTDFVLDTNALFSRSFVEAMSPHCRRDGHRLLVSALVVEERVFQLRRRLAARFDLPTLESFLTTHHISVIPFDGNVANQVAAALYAEFPTDDQWRLAKWRRCAVAVGHQGDPPGRPICPATVDWLIGRHIMGVDTLLVTDDRGAEFGSIRRVGTAEALEMVRSESSV